MKKIVSIMAVFDEQNMIALSIESTKDLVYEFIIIMKEGIDKTEEVIKIVQQKWNLNIQLIKSDLKLREARKYGFELAKDYADYYLIQDGDEIYYTENDLKSQNRQTIVDLIDNDYDLCLTSMINLKTDLRHTYKVDKNHNPPWYNSWLIPHPFLIKNIDNIVWNNNSGDLPSESNFKNIYNTGKEKNPFKFDCVIKNKYRTYLRYSFTQWHDSEHSDKISLEDFVLKYDTGNIGLIPSLKEKYPNENLYQLIDRVDDRLIFSKEIIELYNEEKYLPYPSIIKKYLDLDLIYGIENINNLKNEIN